jgi:hypothetical protein
VVENGEGLQNHALPMSYENYFILPGTNTYTNYLHRAFKNNTKISTRLNALGGCDYIANMANPNATGNYKAVYWQLAMKNSQGYTDAMQQYKRGMNLGFNTNSSSLVKNFTHYALDHSPHRYYLWEETRNIQSQMRGQRYPTPDFYPYQTGWRYVSGAYHGLEWVTDSRLFELKDATNNVANSFVSYGKDAATGNIRGKDHLFSPFVSPGWSREEFLNIRPAQYLGLLKVLGVLGAEFFYAGYFTDVWDEYKTISNNPGYAAIQNTNAGYKYHPNRMIWQAAMPSYAQAVSSYYRDFLIDPNTGNPSTSTLLGSFPITPIQGSNKYYQLPTVIQDPTVAANAEAVAVGRQMGTSYVVSTTLQPKNGAYGNYDFALPNQLFYNPSIAPNTTAKVGVSLPTLSIYLTAATQGITYLIDLNTNPHPGTSQRVIRCIDAWHEWKHPLHWSRSMIIEAELSDTIQGVASYGTLRPTGATTEDYSIFTTYARNNQNYQYSFSPTENGNYAIYVRAASYGNTAASITASVEIKDKNGVLIQNLPLNGVNLPACTGNFHFEWRKFPVPVTVNTSNEHTYTLKINAGTGANALTDIDKFFITINDPLPSTEGQLNNECNP